MPSPKTWPTRLWLARVGYERMQGMADPAMSLNRAREIGQKHSRGKKSLPLTIIYPLQVKK